MRRSVLVAACESVLAEIQGLEPGAMWAALEADGLTRVGVPERMGGAGGGVADALQVVVTLARVGADLPLSETLTAGWALATAGRPVPRGAAALTFARIRSDRFSLYRAQGGWRCDGRLPSVPCAAAVDTILVVAVDVRHVTPALLVLDARHEGVRVDSELRPAAVRCHEVPVESIPLPMLRLAPDHVRTRVDVLRAGVLCAAATDDVAEHEVLAVTGLLEGAAKRLDELTLEDVSVHRPTMLFEACQRLAGVLGDRRLRALAGRSDPLAAAVEVVRGYAADDPSPSPATWG